MCTAQTNTPDTMPAIGSLSPTTESDMEVFEDAIDTTEDMEYDDTVNTNSGGRNDMECGKTVNADSGTHNDNVAIPSFPAAQFRFSMTTAPNLPKASSSAANENMVSLSLSFK